MSVDTSPNGLARLAAHYATGDYTDEVLFDLLGTQALVDKVLHYARSMGVGPVFSDRGPGAITCLTQYGEMIGVNLTDNFPIPCQTGTASPCIQPYLSTY